VIGYGIVQASVPKLLRKTNGAAEGTKAAKVWGAILAVLPMLIAVGVDNNLLIQMGVPDPSAIIPYALVGGLMIFGVVFAINSAVHSYLIVAFSDHDKVALNVGFYYMANAIGRLGGTLLSGLVYQYAGLTACLWVSAGLLVVGFILTLFLNNTQSKSC